MDPDTGGPKNVVPVDPEYWKIISFLNRYQYRKKFEPIDGEL
jgi:hypothetical protein